MRPDTSPPDDGLLQGLPLPLARLYRRALNAKTALERHLNALSLWEAALKLLASAAVVHYAERPEPDPQLAEMLRNLARPTLGHWWEFVYRLLPVLADRGRAPFPRLRELLLGKTRADLPRAAGLDAVLAGALEGKGGARASVRLKELFDRVVRHRNKGVAHGAPAGRTEEYHERLAAALLAGAAEVLGHLDVLAGGRLLYAGEVRQAGDVWLVPRFLLHGESAQRLATLELPWTEAARLPRGERVYLADPSLASPVAPAGAVAEGLLPLHPLLIYDAESEEVLFLNARRGKQRAEYLAYGTGRTLERPDLGGEQRELLARALGLAVSEEQASAWAAQSQAGEPAGPAAGEPPGGGRRTLGEFELLSELGRGGMGVVYRAWQPSLGRQVALKELMKAGDVRAEKRFAREIAALGQVEHPHLVRIFTSGSEGDRWFYAMELVEGTTLAAVCDRLSASGSSAGEVDLATWRQALSTACEEARRGEKPLSDAGPEAPGSAPAVEEGALPGDGAARTGRAYVRRVAELVRQAAEAAHALHEKGVVHRDIKPGNIMVGPDGESATLMDLGLAQVADEVEGRPTRTRQFVGTLRYASPEQVLAVARLDRRSDVYSLGATLWELLTLRPLFGATDAMPTPELMQKIQIEEPSRVRRLNPAVPRDLAAVVEKCLQKDAKKRYATAQELAGELSAFLGGRPVKARPVRGAVRLWMWAKRRPAQASLLVLTVLTLVGLAVGGALFAWQADQAWREADAHARAQFKLRQEADEKRADAENQKKVVESQKKVVEKQATDLQAALGRAEKAEKRGREETEAVKKERERAEGLLANTSVLLADREWEAGHVERARELLAEVPRKLRHLEWNYLWRKFQGSYCTLYGHTSEVKSVAFSPDGRRLASGSGDGTVKVWDLATGREALTLKHTEYVTSVAFSPDGRRVASGSWDKTVKVWDLATAREALTLRGHTSAVTGVAFSPDGRRLASGSADKTVKVWDLDTGREALTLHGHTDHVTSVAFSPGGRRLASGSKDKAVKVWDLATGREALTLKGYDGAVESVAFSPDGRRLASGSFVVKLWNLATGREVRTLKGHTIFVKRVAFSPDGRWLASGALFGTIVVWDLATNGEARILKGHTETVSSVAFSPDGRRLASGSSDWTVRVWDLGAGQEALTLKGHTFFPFRSLAFSPDGRRLAIGSPKAVKVWDLATGREALTLKGHTGPFRSVAFSPDGRRLASGSADKTVKVWDLATGREALALKGHTSHVSSVAFSPGGRRLASGSWDATVKVWDLATGRAPLTLKGHTGPFRSVAFSPDGRRLASGSSDWTVRVWDLGAGQEALTLKGHTGMVTGVAFSPDGRRLASGSADKTVKVWDLDTGREALALKGHTGPVTSVAFFPDGRRLASGSDDKTVKVWDVTTGREVLTLKGHTGPVSSVAFSPDGRRLASGSNYTVKVWDLTRPDTLEGHTNWVIAVAFSPDGRRLASGSADRTVKLWDLATGREAFTLRGHTGYVNGVAFSPDGKTLWSRDKVGRVKAWDVLTGKELANAGSAPLFPSSDARHPSRPLLAFPQRATIRLIDLSPDGDEVGFRQAKARFDPFWHREQASDSEKKAEWFAAAFHRSLLAENTPWDLDAWKKVEDDCGKLGDLGPALAVCDRLLRRYPALAPIYLRRSQIRRKGADVGGGWADLARGLYFSFLDHPDWPEFAAVAEGQGEQAAAKEDWPQAVRQYTVASTWAPREPWVLHRLAWARLAGGDEAGCRSACRRLHVRFGDPESNRNVLTLSVMLGQVLPPLMPGPLVAEQAVRREAARRADVVVWTAILLPDNGIDPRAFVALAGRASYRPMFGAALYRAGRYKQAVQHLEQAVRLQGNGGWPWQNLFLAMAYHRLGQAAKSRACFDKARLDDKAGWELRLIYRRLRQEAEQLRNAPPQSRP